MNQPEIVKLEIRSYGGKDCLFTSDGKLLANQSHYKSGYICNQQQDDGGIYRVFRATFEIDNDDVKLGNPL